LLFQHIHIEEGLRQHRDALGVDNAAAVQAPASSARSATI